MKVLALCSYPAEAAATRFRVAQFVEPLARLGIDLELSPFLSRSQFANLYSREPIAKKLSGVASSILDRVSIVARARRYDLIFVQREAMLFGPPIFEWLYRKIGGVPMVLDLDDATYVRYVSPSYGRLGSALKFFRKTDTLIKSAKIVTCGNQHIASYVASFGIRTTVIPTVADTTMFRPSKKSNDIPVVGWVGTHSTFPFLEWIFPVLDDLATKHRFKLKIVGAGNAKIKSHTFQLENLPWDLQREVEDFQSLDIGLYPMTLTNSTTPEWLMGKSGFKAIQYMAVGVPFVMSPIGVAAEIGEPGITHFNATTLDDWYTHLEKLLSDQNLRLQMGEAGRHYSLENFTVDRNAQLLASTLREAIRQN
jgi:glycosyltransferase involved in cell wall biosynthesis